MVVLTFSFLVGGLRLKLTTLGQWCGENQHQTHAIDDAHVNVDFYIKNVFNNYSTVILGKSNEKMGVVADFFVSIDGVGVRAWLCH
jgi:hypothetical protein